MAEVAGWFFDRRWIDAPPRPGKYGGAFSHGAVPSVHPYILLNYEAKPRDVMTLAHELGHGVHQKLSGVQGVLQADTPLTTAETASVFGEMLVFQSLMARETSPQVRLGDADAEDRGLVRDRLPPDQHEPLRARDPHGPARRGRADRRALRRAVAGARSAPCSATASR